MGNKPFFMVERLVMGTPARTTGANEHLIFIELSSY